MSIQILVTGANGQLARRIKSVFESVHPGVTVYATRQMLDITDAAEVDDFVSKHHFTHIINCAAYTNVERASAEIDRCMAVNVTGASNLAQTALRHHIRLIHISTDYIFDGKATKPYTELDTPAPLSTYGQSKLDGELAVMQLNPDSIVIRTSWLYSNSGNNFVTKIMQKLDVGEPLRVVCDQIGTPTSALDLASAIARIIFSDVWLPGIYNFADNGTCSWYDFAVAIAILAGYDNFSISPIRTNEYPSAAVRPLYSTLCSRKITKCYGITPPHWLVSLKKCIAQIQKK